MYEGTLARTGDRRNRPADGHAARVTRPAVFLDRDGTLIEERGYLDRLDLLTVFPWTADALRLLKRAGFATVVISNQSALARGIIDEAFLSEVHRELSARLERGGGVIDRYYFCPHLGDAQVERYRQACRWRRCSGRRASMRRPR